MGWCSGSELAQDVWDLVRNYIPVKNRPTLAREIIDLFERHDCDTIHEAEQLYEDASYQPDDSDDYDDLDDEPGNHET